MGSQGQPLQYSSMGNEDGARQPLDFISEAFLAAQW